VIRYLAPALFVVLASSCSSGDKGMQAEDTSVDTAGDVFFPQDTTVDSEADATTAPDSDVAVDTAPDSAPDTNPDCNGFGCSCSANADCLDELCIEGQEGFICTKVCSLECPVGFDCLTSTAFGSDPISVCVPRHVPLCRPCLDNGDCASSAVKQGYCLPAANPDDGSFCGTACDDGVPCPEGYGCDAITIEGGAQIHQCRPTSGMCECRPSWASAPYETSCAIKNDVGGCTGRRSCGPDGLLACSGTAAATEICNRQDDDCDGVTDDIVGVACEITRGADACPGTTGCVDGSEVCLGRAPSNEACNDIDDNCDGTTDEGSCFDGLTCTNDVCVASECSNALVLGRCLIDGVCFEAGDTKPDDLCLTCQPNVSTSSFTLAEAIGCDDFNACTQDDTCHSGTCAGTVYACDDGLACTRDTCDGQGGCTAPLSPNNCLIENVCYADGSKKSATSCEVCDSTTSTNAWSGADGATCDDNDPCTKDDACAGTACRGTQSECDDGDPCTVDVCDGRGGCTNTVAASRCNIGGVCYAAGATKPDESCFVCDPDKSGTSWSASAPGASCSDGDACTKSDACSNGLCKGTAYSCGDALACTSETCDGAGGCSVVLDDATCVIDNACVAADARKTPGSCLGCHPLVSTKAWTAVDGEGCNDGQACTKSDTCTGEVCAGTSYSCDDSNTCTVDVCVGDGTCTNAQATTSCVIGGVCYAADSKKPGDGCLACRPEVSTAQWSPVAAGTGCDDAQSCTRDDVCTAGICAGTGYVCNDTLGCTTDGCDGTGGCSVTVNAGSCVVDGVCRVAGALATAGGCLVCDPSSANDAWSPRTGQACNDGASCTKDDACDGTVCTGTSYACDDNIACTADSCDGDGTCTYTLAASACLIAGVCYPDGAQKAGEPCYACRPDISANTWSPALVGTECDDGKPCTSEDECFNGLCAGTAYVCNDGLTCTNDSCDGIGGCTESIVANNCLIDNQCVAAGTVKTVGGCLWCNPAVDPNGWSANTGASCNDGVVCSSNDKCVGSTCQGTGYTCNDGLTCTNDSCNGDGTCTFALQVGSCVIGNVCHADNAPNPLDECLACRSSLATNDWRPVTNNTPCDDDVSCTKNDKCTSGICGGTTYACDDGKLCTTDACNGDGTCRAPIDLGSCLIGTTCYADGAVAGNNACLVCDSEVSQSAFVPNSGAPCNDGAACTKGDLCTGSTCGGIAYSCDDSNACTLDSCNGAGGCSNVQSPTSCTILGVCYAANFAKPGEPCFACRPDISTSTWSAVAAGASCNDGNSCTKSDQCNNGSCAGTTYTCNDGLTCTTDSCDGAGGCGATPTAGNCAIDGACYSNGTRQSAASCLVCTTSQSQTAWSPNPGAGCNDSNLCTGNDTCSGSTCGGTGFSCDDSLTCTNDSCTGTLNGCGHAQVANTCLIGGVCYAANAVKSGDPCLQCRPDLSAINWSPVNGTNVACNDNNLCTNNDKCNAGSCSGTAFTCNDLLSCTTDSCNGTGCSVSVNANFCAIGNACYAAGTTNPSNPCQVCTPASNATGWSNKPANTSCNDNFGCTYGDVCNATGTCGGTGYVCDDGKSCTSNTCTGVQNGCTYAVTTGCLIGGNCLAEGTDNPSNPCQECNGGISRTAYSGGNDGATCNDNNSCSYTDKCMSGSCSGTNYNCDDGKTCTANNCTGVLNGCSYPIIAGNCLIGSNCYTNNTAEPGNVCRYCNSAAATVWTNRNGTCDDNNACTLGDFCSGGLCSIGSYDGDDQEPNNSRAGALAIANSSDCDARMSHSQSNTIYGPGDVDWFRYHVSDNSFCNFYPNVQIANLPVDLDLDIYFTCGNGNTPKSFDCQGATVLPGYGCRSANSGTTSEHLEIDVCCTTGCTGDDHGYIDIYVYKWPGASDPTCNQPYLLQWGDD